MTVEVGPLVDVLRTLGYEVDVTYEPGDYVDVTMFGSTVKTYLTMGKRVSVTGRRVVGTASYGVDWTFSGEDWVAQLMKKVIDDSDV